MNGRGGTLGEWRGRRLDRMALLTGWLDYEIEPPRTDSGAFDRIAQGLSARFDVTRRASTSLIFAKGEGFERPSDNPFRSVDRGSLDLLSGTGDVATLRRRLAVRLSVRSHLAFLIFAFVAIWLIGFHDSNPLWWALAWLGVSVWSVEGVRRRVGRQLAEWAEG